MPMRAPLLITLLAGASGLVHELVWSRYLALIFGVSAHAIAVVLAGFMAGLALGGWWFGRRSGRGDVPAARLLIGLHLALAVVIALSPLAHHALAAVTSLVLQTVEPGPTGRLLLRLALALPAVLAPAALLGGTFPALLQARRDALPRTTGDETAADGTGRSIGMLYAANTLGGAGAAFLTGFVLIRHLGLAGSLAVAAALQATGAWVAWKTFGRVASPSPAAAVPMVSRRRPPAPASEAGPSAALRLATHLTLGVSGFTALAYQVQWTRLLTFFFRDSLYDFAIVLTTFLGGLVIGGLLGARWSRRSERSAASALALVQLAIGLGALAGLFLVARLPYLINDLQTNTALVARHGEAFWTVGVLVRFGYAAALMLGPTILFGAAFPLASRVVCAGEPGSLGQRSGLLGATNALGATAGALGSGLVFTAALGLRDGIVATAALNLVAGGGLFVFAAKPTARAVRLAGALATAGVAALIATTVPGWDRLRMSTSFLDQSQPLEELLDLKFYREDAGGVTSVVELVPLARRYLVSNRLYAHNTSETGGLDDHRRLGHLPALLHPDPRDTLVVGLGAGVTLRGVVEHGGAVDCVELSPGVLEAARFFGKENGGVMDNPRVHFVVDDGRSHMAATRARYDVIVMDILFPMSAGSSTVFSREYYAACRARLKPGGLVCQWLPVHQLSPVEIRIITATFLDVFPHTSVWHGLIGDSVAVVGLIGTEAPLAIDGETLRRRHAHLDRAGTLDEINLGRPELVLSHFLMAGDAVAAFCRGAPLNTDDRPRVEFLAPLLAVQARAQGAANLLALARHAGDAALPLNEPAAPPDERAARHATINRDRIAKRTLIEALARDAAGDPDARARLLAEALARDPGNEDLRWITGAP